MTRALLFYGAAIAAIAGFVLGAVLALPELWWFVTVPAFTVILIAARDEPTGGWF